MHPVPPAQVQSELSRLWETLETKNTTRASLFNLIFFTEKNHRTSYFRKVAEKAIQRFPSRVIFITTDRQAKDSSLKTEVSILTSSKGECDVACDYIQIEAEGDADQKIPFLVLPLLLPDLPVYLIWAEDPKKNDPLCNELAHLAERLIFDSEITENFAHFAKSVLDNQAAIQCAVADLNWARIEDLRDLFSMVFYSPDKLEKIQRTQTIDILYNAEETPFFCHTKIQSIYLQSWLACQLGWTLKQMKMENNSLIFSYENGTIPVTVTISSENNPKLPPGIVLSTHLKTTKGESFHFDRTRDRLQQIQLQYSDATCCDLPCYYLFTKAESGHSLIKEIFHKDTSKHFLNVLNFIQKMECLKRC